MSTTVSRLRRIHPGWILVVLDVIGLAIASDLSVVELGGASRVRTAQGSETVALSEYRRSAVHRWRCTASRCRSCCSPWRSRGSAPTTRSRLDLHAGSVAGRRDLRGVTILWLQLAIIQPCACGAPRTACRSSCGSSWPARSGCAGAAAGRLH